MAVSFKPIKPLLQTGTNAVSRWLSYLGLGIGVLLLLCSMQMYMNIQNLLGKDTVRQGGFDFVSITKTVTNATMGQPEKNLFSAQEVDELKTKPFIFDAAPLESNQFRALLSGGAVLPFKTDLPLESIDDAFIDTLPPSFTWVPGQRSIPVIISSDYLEVWNVFSPSQGLPQISQSTAGAIQLELTCSGKGQSASFKASIVAFSDRINSVLVPKSFLNWANKEFGEAPGPGFSRLYLKSKDANNPELISFLDQKNYKVNKDRVKFGRAKQTLQGIFGGLSLFGVLVVIMALTLFSFYLQLLIARSRDSLQLLLLLGYSPGWLGKKLSSQFIPVYVFIVLAALAITQLIQWAFQHLVMHDRPEVSVYVSWVVCAIALGLILLSIFANGRLVRSLLRKL